MSCAAVPTASASSCEAPMRRMATPLLTALPTAPLLAALPTTSLLAALPTTPLLTEVCALASFVCVVPHTNDANPHRRRICGRGRGWHSSPPTPPLATHAAPPTPPLVAAPRRGARTAALRCAAPLSALHSSRKCVGLRYLYVLHHIQMTRTHTRGGCMRIQAP